jgi:hypothetical protein
MWRKSSADSARDRDEWRDVTASFSDAQDQIPSQNSVPLFPFYLLFKCSSLPFVPCSRPHAATEPVTRTRPNPLSKFRTFVPFVTFRSNALRSLLFPVPDPHAATEPVTRIRSNPLSKFRTFVPLLPSVQMLFAPFCSREPIHK